MASVPLSRQWILDLKYKHRYAFTFLMTQSQGEAFETAAGSELLVAPQVDTIEDQWFDTSDWCRAAATPSSGQSHYNIRRFGCRWDVLLQRRKRKKDQQSLRQSKVLISELSTLDQPDKESDWAGRWFQKQTVQSGLRPSCRIRFQRTSFDLDDAEGPVRLTLDSGFLWSRGSEPLVSRQNLNWHSSAFRLVRMKFPSSLPSRFKTLIYEHALLPIRTTAYAECLRRANQNGQLTGTSSANMQSEEIPCRIG